LGEGAKGFFVSGPYPLPQTPTPNPLKGVGGRVEGWTRCQWEKIMPFVNIKITKDGATPEQKAELIKGVTDLLVKVLHKNPATSVVVIEEVETDNWGIGGETVTARRGQGK
jgi:4-oxalocrotonate tautomerase